MSTNDELQTHLNTSIYGPPQTNPDERRRYLGSLRERVLVRVTNSQIEAPAALAAVKSALTAHAGDPAYKLLLNGKLNPALTAPYMAAANEHNCQFTLVADDTADLDAGGSGALMVADHAINTQDIGVASSDAAPSPKKKRGFLSNLFG